MNDVVDCYVLRDVKVDPESMLLDPQNPRLAIEDGDKRGTAEDVTDSRLQDAIIKEISEAHHRIADLVESIKTQGFMDGTNPIIVKEISGKYLVLEGNRRTAAIKHLLAKPTDLNNNIRKSLTRIPVKKFEYIGNDEFDEDEVIDVILGLTHISGPLQWGAMERAHYIYRTYMREMSRNTQTSAFMVNQEVLNKVGSMFNLKKTDVLTSLKVYRVFQSLKHAGFEVEPDKYSLIDMAVKDSTLSNDVFELNESFEFSEQGSDRFHTLCLSPSAKVTNPSLMRKLKLIASNDSEDYLTRVVEGSQSVEEVHALVKRKMSERQVLEELQAIRDQLSEISLVRFQNTEQEKMVAREIATIVQHKLAPLVKRKAKFEYPSNVTEAIRMSGDGVQQWIKETLSYKSNKSLKESRLVLEALGMAELVVRGQKRKELETKFEKQVEKMVRTGIVERRDLPAGTRLKLLSIR